MPINPVQFAHQICDEFIRYLFTAFPLSDPELKDQVRKFFDKPSSLEMPLLKGPYVSLSEAFAEGEPVQSLANVGILHPALPDLIGFEKMWLHQQQVFEAVRRGEHVLISTGTGSGKTEAFLYPIVDELLQERDQGILSGLKAILVYPMNALANDQLDRLRDMLGGTGITFGQWIGSTPEQESKIYGDRFEGSSRPAYLQARRQRWEEALAEDRSARPLLPPEECASEAEIRQRKPRILLTNYRQLEILTTRLPDVQLFADTPLRYLVFDEAHTYQGAVGAEVACLVRRVRALAGKKPDEVICIGTSATLTDPDKEQQDDIGAAKRFAARFFGVEQEKVTLVGESYVKREWPKERYRPVPPQGNGMERLGRLLKALEEPIDVTSIREIVEELTGGVFEPDRNWQESLYRLLLSNHYVYQCTEILSRPQLLSEGAWRISQRVTPGRLPEGEKATAELLAYLLLGAAAQRDGQPLLRPKVHFFIRGLDEMVVALDGTPERTEPLVFMSIQAGRDTYPERRSDAFFPILTCRSCGQHFLEKNFINSEITRDSKNRIKAFTGGNATVDDAGNENAVWTPAPEGQGTRLILTNRLLEESETDAESPRAQKYPTLWFCRNCGAFHRHPSDRCLADGCKHQEPLLPLLAVGESLTSCPSCGSLAIRIGGREIEPARRVRAVTVADVHILAQAMVSAAPEQHKKLVIFTDSRQDAAFQAGWMQDHARRIRLRHMMYQVLADADGSVTLGAITDQLMELFRKDRRLVDTLLPELTGEEAESYFGHDLWVNVHRALRYMVLREFTTGVRRRDCLEAMGLARVEYQGLRTDHPDIINWGRLLGISPEMTVDAISLILDLWRRSRILYVENHPIFSRFHAKDDQYIQAGLLPLRDFRPEGIVLEKKDKDKYARGLLAPHGASGLQSLLKKWSRNLESNDTGLLVLSLWKLLTDELRILTRVTLRSQKEKPLGDVWQIDSKTIFVQKSWAKHRCTTCQRIVTRLAPLNTCSRHHCKGTTIPEEPERDDYDVSLMGKPFTMVSAEEHTAQVPGEARERIEQDFKSKNGKSNCLVATPTLELGVNIGALDMVLLRNVPPKSSNYWQRAGRAGRQERMAVVVTYCRRSAHDRYFFDDPLRLLDGSIEVPAFNLQNPLMVAKHVRSALLSQLLLRSRGSGADAVRIRDIIGDTFPIYIRNYLLNEENKFLDAPLSTFPFQVLLGELKDEMVNQLLNLFAQNWPAETAELTNPDALARIISSTADELQTVLKRLHRRLAWARSTRAELHKKKDEGLIEREEAQLLKRCDEFINNIVIRDRSTYTLTVLGNEGFLPGYGIYEGGITASAQSGLARRPGPQAFDLSRNSAIALREFIPGNRLYANRGTFYAARYHLGAGESTGIQTLQISPEKYYVTDAEGSAAYGQSGAVTMDALPITDLDLALEGRISEDENLRFAMPVTVLGRLRKRNRGGKAYKIGDFEVHHIHGQGIELVNIGEAGKVKKNEFGHIICTVCGGAKSCYAVDAERQRFIEIHKNRCGREPYPIVLTAQVEVDLFQIFSVNSESVGYNIGESLRTAARRLLDMGENDLELLLIRKTDETIDLFIYDPMPGGSGLLEQMLNRWKELIRTAKELLTECSNQCETACYSCLKTFRNQFYHEHLDRHCALPLMEKLDNVPQFYRDITPIFEEERPEAGSPSNSRESQLHRLLIEHHFPPGKCREPIEIPPGLSTTPDWFYSDPNHASIKVAVYLDGMSKHLHGDPKQAQMDHLLRQMLELQGYIVIVIQSRDLDDPEAMRLRLRNIAQAIGREDLI